MARVREQLICKDPSLTQQCFKDECDINNIMARWVKDGLVAHVSRYQGRYDDVSSAEDYHTSLNRVIAAQDAFDSLPAVIRTKFDNDPGKFLEFVEDPANRNEMCELGLLPEEQSVEVSKPADKKAEALSQPSSSKE